MKIIDLQNNGIDMLKKVTDKLDEKQIRYFLAYGTQLGATRHQDFIPWDYDTDITCLKEDYEKIKVALSELDQYSVEFNEETKNNKSLASIVIYDKNKTKYYRERNIGMYLDIFLFDHGAPITKIVKMFYKCFNFRDSMNRKVNYFGWNNLYKVLRLENFNVVKSIVFIMAYIVMKLLVPLMKVYVRSKQSKDFYTYSIDANTNALDIETFLHPKAWIETPYEKKAQIRDHKYYQLSYLDEYLDTSFNGKWRTPLDEKSQKQQILTMFPKVITNKKVISQPKK